MSKKKSYIISTILVILAIVFTVLVKIIDVKPVGLQGTDIGFSSINTTERDLIGTNTFFYNLTEVLGIVAILIVLAYGLLGLYQLIKRKSLLKVDKELICMGILYAVVIGLYVLFEHVIINYRPVLEDGVLEASYPSSHTLLTLCVCGSAILFNKKKLNTKYTKIINIVLAIIMFTTVIGRLISGVHWLTDIIGGTLISLAILSTYNSIIKEDK